MRDSNVGKKMDELRNELKRTNCVHVVKLRIGQI